MTFQIVASSPKALATTEVKRSSIEAFPFQQLEVGQSFLVPFNTVAESTIRNNASKVGKKLSRKFSVVKHEDPHNVFEVARIA